MELSVVVATYNRCDVLARTLEHLAGQAFPRGQYEIVVADDGSTDATAAVLRSAACPVPLRHAVQPRRGAASCCSSTPTFGPIPACWPPTTGTTRRGRRGSRCRAPR